MEKESDFFTPPAQLPSIFHIKRVGGPSVFMRAWLHRYANQHSAIYIVLLSAYEVVDVNG